MSRGEQRSDGNDADDAQQTRDDRPRVRVDRIAGYRIDDVIGEGGMGIVYAAFDERIGRRVAVKVLHSGSSSSTSRALLEQRLKREAQAAGRIKSAHTVQVLHAGDTETGEPFIAMELVEGRSLKAEIASTRAFPPERAVAIARQLCAGVGAAHDLGVVHRDLKPANIVLVEEGTTRDFVKILDFGVAKVLDAERALTEAGSIIGTVQYMAPEQLSGQPVDERADIYAFGLVLFEMLAGERAYKSKSPLALLQQEERGFSWDRAASTRRALPSALVDVVARCLEVEPARRYASMRDVDAALAGALASPLVDVGGQGDVDDHAGDAGEPATLIEANKREREQRYETERGRALLTVEGPGVVVVRFDGVADERLARFTREACEPLMRELATGVVLRVYFDTTKMTAFERAFRRFMVRWHADTAGAMEQVVLVRSKIVAILVRNANRLIGGGASTTSDRAAFESSWKRDVASRSL